MTQTSALTYGPQADHPGSLPPQARGHLQPDDLSPKGDSTVDRQNLVAALGTHMARKPPVSPRDRAPGPLELLPWPWRAQRVLSVPADPHKWPSSLGDPLGPLSVGTDPGVQALLRDLGQRQADGDAPGPLGLDDMARLTGSAAWGAGPGGQLDSASSEAGEDPGQQAALPDPGGRRGSDGLSEPPPGGSIRPSLAGARERDASRRAQEEAPRLSPPPQAPSIGTGARLLPGGPPPRAPFTVERKKSEVPPSSEEEHAGAEDVRSRTYSRELPPGGREQGAWHPGTAVGGRPGQGLQLQAPPPQEERGYLVTDRDPLGPAQATELLQRVAGLLELPAGILGASSVLGPAVTFTVSPNGRNVTAADVARTAAANKDALEKASGLKILQAGAGPELCRQRMTTRASDRPEAPHASRISSVSSQLSDGPGPSPSARSSTSSWSEEPVPSSMDISTGHMVLAYMEDHLKNKNRLEKEWEALCAYQAEPNSSLVAQREENAAKNRCPAVLTYDHSRILLKSENSHSHSDYINASPIMDHDPRSPAYIATQGPLPATTADFWQMVWESGCAVIVMLTPLAENGVRQCHPYWPDEGATLYHVYEVNLVSEHIWCEDFLVRSFYLKNLQTSETRTVTQFHFLSWYDQGVPASARSLLDFRRKVNKCYRGRSCPIIVHCSDGAGRSGTYVLIDMVLNKMAKGAKEIDIAATLEHLRDQRPGMVQTKEQFEFALTAVAEEVNAILKALPQ
ncbi:receptor-type tyrosine-protein phosphatase N2 [Talpa occidentalis]|uniref:receptor-type tyrosine-protein phosphatase N2 n=1 Tax=Talpa occidentalis TaxID=50954 RepID=UPI0023F84154|nr:receptor-type tyrosine-protein phosphatase N2 [Talpa occidentalis]